MSSPPSSDAFDLEQLKTVITEIVKSESRQILQHLTSSSSDINNERDQGIESQHMTRLEEMDKIPDVVKSLREFSGQAGEFSSWKKSVDRILSIYEGSKGTPRYYGILNVIRNKITGNADIALESYNTPLNWEKISKCLTLHYADKRDLGTLEYQMTTLVQRNNSIPEFYQEVYYHLSLILNKIASMEMSQESMNIMTRAYRDKALDTFIRGLKGDLPRLLSMREPNDLPQALHLCLKLENVHYRIQHSLGNVRYGHSPAPPLPPKRTHNQTYHPLPPQRRSFLPELLHNPQAPRAFTGPPHPRPPTHPPQYHPQLHRQSDNQTRPNLPRPEPMDIDSSLRSQRVNYMNRPPIQNTANKRQHSHQMHQPTKFQRVYHTEQSAEDDVDDETAQYQEKITESDTEFEQNLQDFLDPQDYAEQVDDIHFLD